LSYIPLELEAAGTNALLTTIQCSLPSVSSESCHRGRRSVLSCSRRQAKHFEHLVVISDRPARSSLRAAVRSPTQIHVNGNVHI